MEKDKKTFIAVYAGECSIKDSVEEAMIDLVENCTHEPDFKDINFYEAKLLKVKQIIIIENEKESATIEDS